MNLLKVLKFLDKTCTTPFLLLIAFYRRCISPSLGSRCRFFPSCSAYGREALEKYGVVKGLTKTTIRVCKCHPFHPGGVDFP